MAWLFLLAYWIVALVVVSLAYALWNRGLTGGLAIVGTESAEGSPVEDLPERILGSGPKVPVFEGDRIEVTLRIESPRGTRGPARISASIGTAQLSTAAGLVRKEGWEEVQVVGPVRRGRVDARGMSLERGDPLGFFKHHGPRVESELGLVLPRFTALAARPHVRELEASAAAPRAGSGTEMFGVREYRPGDPLRRIHWRSSARHGELIVREFEPPGVQTLGIFCDPSPPTPDAADQIARLAASEAWDCLRTGGRVVLWAPGAEPSAPSESRSLWALLEWLARYPGPHPAGSQGEQADLPTRWGGQAPRVSDAIAVLATANFEIDDALETIRLRGGAVRAWVVGDAKMDSAVSTQRAGLAWPLP
ncbi:MAG TPA: DUF58 domain-containing protein [Candidatus Dormibacteraeota bacterium]